MTENPHDMLRTFPVLAADLPTVDDETAPHDPVPLFVRWLNEAIEKQVPEPHVMTLSTCDTYGRASSHVLLCTDVREEGLWSFASVEGRLTSHHPDAHPPATLTFHWPRIGCQIRICGTVARAGNEADATDYPTRPAALAARHSSAASPRRWRIRASSRPPSSRH
ncbi:pyridoxamine 5'-phosphate oxidase family protein [Streptomyces sp. NPDC048723]|uniref:pyridoxamine 5'-phosphate oxidase family protein n=1 Tax=Streptomyces sp. NPDC048723 TaxID=3365589 RepID=UPI003723060B